MVLVQAERRDQLVSRAASFPANGLFSLELSKWRSANTQQARLKLWIHDSVGLLPVFSAPFELPTGRHQMDDAIELDLKLPPFGFLQLRLPFDILNVKQRMWLKRDPHIYVHFLRAPTTPEEDGGQKCIAFHKVVRLEGYDTILKDTECFYLPIGPVEVGKWQVWLSGSDGWRTPLKEIYVIADADNFEILIRPEMHSNLLFQFSAEINWVEGQPMVWEREKGQSYYQRIPTQTDTLFPLVVSSPVSENCSRLIVVRPLVSLRREKESKVYFWNIDLDSGDHAPKKGGPVKPCLSLDQPFSATTLSAWDGVELYWLTIAPIDPYSKPYLGSVPPEGVRVLVSANKVHLYGLTPGMYRIEQTPYRGVGKPQVTLLFKKGPLSGDFESPSPWSPRNK